MNRAYNLALEHWFSPRTVLPPRGHLTMSGDSLVCNTRGVVLASRRSRAGMLLKHPARTGQPPPQRMIWPQMSRVPEFKAGFVFC